MNKIEEKKKRILNILIYLVDKNIWDDAKNYAIILYNLKKTNNKLLNSLDKLLLTIVANTENLGVQKKLMKTKKLLKKIKNNEKKDLKKEQIENQQLINSLL